MQQAAIWSLFFWARNETRALGIDWLLWDCCLAQRLVLNFTAALFRWEEVASFLKHIETKRKWAVCSSLLIVVSFFFSFFYSPPCPTSWMAIIANFLFAARIPVPLRLPWPCGIQGERDGSCQILHLSLAPVGNSPPAAAPRGFCSTLPLISSISSLEGPSSDCGPFFSPLLPSAPLKSCVRVSLWLERLW